jgi:hypothetical protein
MPFGGDQRTDRELTTEMQETLAGQFAWLIRSKIRAGHRSGKFECQTGKVNPFFIL